MKSWIVAANESGTKLLVFLKNKMGEEYSSKLLKRSIESNQCEVNGRVERFASVVVGTGDKVALNIASSNTPKVDINKSQILHEDDYLLVYNKPAGVASEGKELAQLGYHLVHRLDKETTGALIFAKNEQVREQMFALFRQHEVEKHYLAIVDGIPSKKNGLVDNYLGKLNEYQGQTLWGEVDKEKGLHAITEWFVERSGNGTSLIRCLPKTGRTHQIRVHMAGMGHPILGDHQYGRKFKCEYKPKRIMLHALSVTFKPPSMHEMITIEAPLPNDFQEYIRVIFSHTR